jgi:hypothetical protein
MVKPKVPHAIEFDSSTIARYQRQHVTPEKVGYKYKPKTPAGQPPYTIKTTPIEIQNPWLASQQKVEVKLAGEREIYGGLTHEEWQTIKQQKWNEEKVARTAQEKQLIKTIQNTYTTSQLKQVSPEILQRMPILEKYGSKIAVTKSGAEALKAQKAYDAKLRAEVDRLGVKDFDLDSFKRWQRQQMAFSPTETTYRFGEPTYDIDAWVRYQRQQIVKIPTEIKHYASTTGKTTFEPSWQRQQITKMRVGERLPVPATTQDSASYQRWLKQQKAIERQQSSIKAASEERSVLQQQKPLLSFEEKPSPFIGEFKMVEGVPVKVIYTKGIKGLAFKSTETTVMKKPGPEVKKLKPEREITSGGYVLKTELEVIKEKVTINKEIIQKGEEAIKQLKNRFSQENVTKVLKNLRQAALNSLRTTYTTSSERIKLKNYIQEINKMLGEVEVAGSSNKALMQEISKLKQIQASFESELKPSNLESMSASERAKLVNDLNKVSSKLDDFQSKAYVNLQKQSELQRSLSATLNLQQQKSAQLQSFMPVQIQTFTPVQISIQRQDLIQPQIFTQEYAYKFPKPSYELGVKFKRPETPFKKKTYEEQQKYLNRQEQAQKESIRLRRQLSGPKFYTERFYNFPSFVPVAYAKPFSGPVRAQFKPVNWRATSTWVRQEQSKASGRPNAKIPRTL